MDTKDGRVSAQQAGSVEASLSKVIPALLIDIFVVVILSIFLCSAVYESSYGTSEYAVLICMAAIVLASWTYGVLCFSGHTLGTLMAGTRIVKVKNDAAPGFWGGGWMMFFRTVVICLSPLIILAAFFDGGIDSLSPSPIHFSIDKKASAESAANEGVSQ